MSLFSVAMRVWLLNDVNDEKTMNTVVFTKIIRVEMKNKKITNFLNEWKRNMVTVVVILASAQKCTLPYSLAFN